MTALSDTVKFLTELQSRAELSGKQNKKLEKAQGISQKLVAFNRLNERKN